MRDFSSQLQQKLLSSEDAWKEESKEQMRKEAHKSGLLHPHGQVVLLNDDDFDEAIGLNDVVVVDFFSDTCGPCRLAYPKYEALAEKYGQQALFTKVNAGSDGAEVAKRLGVRALPMFLIYKGGEVVGVSAGANIDKVEKELINALS